MSRIPRRARAPIAGLISVLFGLAPSRGADLVSHVGGLNAPQDPAGEAIRAASPNAEVEAATASFRAGNVEEARRQLAAAVAANPGLPPADALLAVLYLTSNRTAQGRLLLERAAAQGPDHPDVYLLFGRIALAERRLTDARLAFEKAASIPLPPGLTEEQEILLKIGSEEGLARVAEGRGRWDEARDHIQAVLELQPRNGSLRQRLGRALFMAGQADPAFEALRQASLDDPSLQPAGIAMGQLYAQGGDQAKAREWMDYAVEAEPRSEKPRIGRASWLIDQGRGEEARADLDALLRLGPPSAEVRRLRGLLAFSAGDFAGAEADFQALAEAAPTNVEVANLLALSLAAQDDAEPRRRALEQAAVNARQFPNLPVVLATLGWAQFRMGQTDQAEETFRAAAGKGQFTSDATFHFALVLEAKGKLADARQLVETSLKVPGGFLQRAKAQAWLTDHPAAGPGPTP